MMNVSFNKILIPVDFTINTKVAIKKALALCEGPDTSIHLLHVVKISATNVISIYQYFANYSFTRHEFDMRQEKQELENIKAYIQNARPAIKTFTWLSFADSVETAIIEKAVELAADIIIIGKNSHHSWLPFLNTVVSSRIAKKSDVTVLTVKPGAIDNSIRTVVIPVDDSFPASKLAVINSIQKKFRIHIKLVAFLTGEGNSPVLPASMLNAYRVLKTSPGAAVSYDVLYGANRARAILKYCKKVKADLLIVNPESETKIGWMNKHISDVLPVQSKTQILAVRPA